MLVGDEEESLIITKARMVKISVKQEGSSFVIEAHFVNHFFFGQVRKHAVRVRANKL